MEQGGAFLCTRMCHQTLTRPWHALSKNAICPIKLTPCDEGTITREGSTWRGDITQERKEGEQVHKMGQVYAPHPCHNPSRNPRMHCQQNPIAQSNSLAATKEARHGWEACCGRRHPEEKGRLAMEQGGAFICTTHVPSYSHATLACIVKKSHSTNQTHSL